MSITTWTDFKRYVSQLEKTTDKGKHFEVFCYYLLSLCPNYNYRIKKIWFYSDFPAKRKEKLLLYQRDMGSDIILKLKDEYSNDDKKYVAVQCKFLSDENQAYTHKQLATFCEDVNLLSEGILISTQNNPTFFNGTDHYKHRTISQIVLKNILEIEPELMELIIKQTMNHMNGEKTDEQRYDMTKMTERPYQKECIKAGVEYFKENNKGVIWAAGGCGKTFMSISLHNRLCEGQETNRLMMVVPSLFLIEQTMKYFTQSGDNNFIVNFCSIEENNSHNIKFTTNEFSLMNFITKYFGMPNTNLVMLVTYQSLQKCFQVLDNSVVFDTIIFDEAHTLVNDKGVISNWFFNNHSTLPTKRQLFLSATPKYVKTSSKECVVSLDDKSQFGEIFFRYSMRRAINEGYLSEYHVYVPVTSTITMKQVMLFLSQHDLVDSEAPKEDDKVVPVFWRLVLAAFAIKDAFHRGKEKCFAVCNRIKDMKLLIQIVRLICKQDGEIIYANSIDGQTKTSVREQISKEYQTTNQKALIVCVRTLTTGADIPCIDSVCIVNPIKSETLITQIICRGIRLYKNKTLDILIPILEDEKSFDTLRNIVLSLDTEDDEFLEFARSGSILKMKPLVFNNAFNMWNKEQPEQPCFNLEEQIKTWRMELLNKERIFEQYKAKTAAMIAKINKEGKMIGDADKEFGAYVCRIKTMFCNTPNIKPCFGKERKKEFEMLSQCVIWIKWYEEYLRKNKNKTKSDSAVKRAPQSSPEQLLEKTKRMIEEMTDTNQMISRDDPIFGSHFIHVKTKFKNSTLGDKKGFSEEREEEFKLLQKCPIFMNWYQTKGFRTAKPKSTPEECMTQTKEIISIITGKSKMIENREYRDKLFLKSLRKYFKETYFKEGKGFSKDRMPEFKELENCPVWMAWFNKTYVDVEPNVETNVETKE